MELATAVILKSIDYSDTQKIIRVYSREKGFLSLITPSYIFKRKSKPVHLLQTVEIEYIKNEKGNLERLSTIAPLSNLPDLYFDIFKMNIILLWGEILNLLLSKEGKNEDLFDFIVRSTEYLNATQDDAGNFNLFFLYRLASFLGFRIDTDSWQEGYVFNIEDGGFHSPEQQKPHISGPNTAKVIYRLCTYPLESIRDIILNREARNVLLDVILLFYSTHFNINFQIKSIQVIREIFS